jgi:DNA-binding LytR/AlgR family response regulator
VTYVDSIDCDDLRIILCIEFDPRASPSEIAALKAALMEEPSALHSVESAGSFDFVIEIAPHDMAAFNRMMKRFGAQFAELAARCETSFVCKRYVRRSSDDGALWVRSGDGLQRVDLHTVDKIAADGDYVQVFADGRKWLLHTTMHALRRNLSTRDFVQLHRSLIVRRGFIDRLSHQGRSWSAHLGDGSLERISKSHLSEALDATRSATIAPESSTIVGFGDGPELRLAKS